MKLKDAVQDINKELKTLNSFEYFKSFGYSFGFIKQGFRDIFYGIKQILITILCLSLYPLMPIVYPFAVLIRIIKK